MAKFICNFFLLKEYLKIYNEFHKDKLPRRTYSLSIYCISKTFKIMVLLKKMHKDIEFDFIDDILELGSLFNENPQLTNAASCNGLDINWLTNADIPNDIDKIEKNIRQQGLLR